MINVDISNIWCSVSLPDFLGSERVLDQAQTALGGDARRYYHWLGQSDIVAREYLAKIADAAEEIRLNSGLLLVVGTGLCLQGARAAQRLHFGRRGTTPRILYAGENFSGEDWLEVISALEQTDYSVLVTSPLGSELQPLIALRSLRWIMEKRYGDRAKSRIYVVTGTQSSPLRNLALEEGYHLLNLSADGTGAASTLNPAGLLLMAVAGLSPSLVQKGALDLLEQCRDRSLDNPAWIYAGAKRILAKAGVDREYVCTWGPSAGELGQWWAKAAACGSTFPSPVRLPEDLTSVGGSLLDPLRHQLVTLLALPAETKKVCVETAWRDTDHLAALAGRELAFVSQKAQEIFQTYLSEAGVPLLTLQCQDTLTDDRVGELLAFLEYSSLLSAKLQGSTALGCDLGLLPGILDEAMGRKLS